MPGRQNIKEYTKEYIKSRYHMKEYRQKIQKKYV